MSKPADKAAQRSAKKEQFFGPSGFSLKPKPICRESWWATASGVDDREKFIAAAKTRAQDYAWGNAVPAAVTTRGYQ